MQGDVESISKRCQEWVNAVNVGALDDYISLLTPDAGWIPPVSQPCGARKAFGNGPLRPLRRSGTNSRCLTTMFASAASRLALPADISYSGDANKTDVGTSSVASMTMTARCRDPWTNVTTLTEITWGGESRWHR